MVKTGKKAGAKKQKQQQRRPSTRSPVTIDGAAVAHIRLMADPCMGRLTPPAYPGSTNGAIMRFRNVISLATGASETAGLFHWNPSINEYYANGAATATTAYTPSASSMFTYLQTGGTSNLGQVYRCIAGCVRIIFNGSENNRGGIVYAGNTTSASYGAGQSGAGTPNVQAIVPILPYTARVPASNMEVLWVPSEADMGFSSDSTVMGAANAPYYGTAGSSITIGVIGLPSAVGVTIEVTGVYEVEYGGSGMCNAVGPPASSSSWQNVLKGFFNAIKGSTVILDGAKAGMDYFGTTGAATIGANVARMAIGYL